MWPGKIYTFIIRGLLLKLNLYFWPHFSSIIIIVIIHYSQQVKNSNVFKYSLYIFAFQTKISIQWLNLIEINLQKEPTTCSIVCKCIRRTFSTQFSSVIEKEPRSHEETEDLQFPPNFSLCLLCVIFPLQSSRNPRGNS